MNKVTLLAASALAAFALSACDQQGPAEQAGETVDDAYDEPIGERDYIGGATEEAGETLDNAADETGEAIEGAGDELEEATDGVERQP